MFRTLRWRIIAAFAAVIVLAVLLSIGVAYWSSQSQLQALLGDIAEEEAHSLAEAVEVQYNRTGDWDEVVRLLAEFGYDSTLTPEAFGMDFGGGVFGFDEEAVDGAFFAEEVFVNEIRPIIIDPNNIVLFDGYGEMTGRELEIDLPDASEPIIDWQTGEPIGTLSVIVTDIYLADEFNQFLSGMLFSTLSGGFLTAALAILIAVWLARRITAPVTALTAAAASLAASGSSDVLPVNSADELGQMSQTFNQMTSALTEQRELRQRLIRDVSHELGTPLSVIQLETKAMQDEMQTPDEAATAIQQEVALLHNLVQDLELIAESDAGALRLNCESVDAADFLDLAVSRWQTQAEAAGVQLRLAIDETLPAIEIDELRMNQVMGNLIRNALYYTEQGGEVVVSAESTPSTMMIQVRDTGVGISAEHLPHIFERFYRVDAARQRGRGGRGLGLAIVKQLVELHGGGISAESRPAVGSTFSINLPAG